MAILDTPSAARWLGDQVRIWRTTHGMTYTEAAARIGISRGALGRIETARVGFPRASIAQIAKVVGIPALHIACAYGCTLDELFEETCWVDDAQAIDDKPTMVVRTQQLHARWRDDAYWDAVIAMAEAA